VPPKRRSTKSGIEPVNVAIIGGGCAAVTTAFELTRPEHNGRFRVTIYQLGWRLGGKGASGRGAAGRIEEHGLHLWMGFYENAFRLLRECYVELGRTPGACPIVDWQDAFYPAPAAGLADHTPRGDWKVWTALIPPGGGLPGDPGRRPQRWTVADLLLRSVSLISEVLERVASPAREQGEGRSSLFQGSPDALVARMMRLARELGPMASLASVIEGVGVLRSVLGMLPAFPLARVQEFYDSVEGAARAQMAVLTEGDDERRRVWELVDMLLAVLRGSLRFGLLTDPRGFDAIDEYDCREWLRMNGASERAVNSAFVRGLHDLALAYEAGDPDRPRISAGEGLRGSFRAFFNYRGAFFWKMRAGMGDVVFAPFYEVLKRRGVQFQFFHRLRHVRLSKESRSGARELPHVEALEFDVQAETIRPEYHPLVDVGGLPCWPSEPVWSQLVDGARLASAKVDFESHDENHRVRRKTARVGRDFDLVVLGIGLGAVRHVCGELVARSQRWRELVDHVATVPTQAFQLWLREDMESLGWSAGSLSSLSAFVEPFGTWADMTHLVARESWPKPPKAIAYFCGVLPDLPASEVAGQHEHVRRNAIRFLNQDIGKLWPNVERAPGRFKWDLLVSPPDARRRATTAATGERRFATQFWKANVNPSDRYVQSLPGTSRYRISPLEQQFDNLTIAGDWTDCGLNIGCVEAAVMSGRLAAHALSKSPPLCDIAGYDFP